MNRQIAKIERTFLGYEDHGILTCWLHLKYGSSGQGAGGYCLDGPRHDNDGKFAGRVGSAYGMEFVARLLKACGVDSWEKLPGRTVYAIRSSDDWHAKIVGIEPLPTEKGERFLFDDIKGVTDAPPSVPA